MKKYKSLAFLILILVSGCSIKKNSTSKQYFHSNEKVKKITIKNLKPISFKWENEEKNIQFTEFYKDSLDSVVVVNNGYFASTFYLKNNRVSSSVIKEFDAKGNLIQLDTIIPGVTGNKVYFFENEFSVSAISERTYDETGRLRKLKLNDANGYDSVIFIWNQNGICQESKNIHHEATYSDNGVLQTLKDKDKPSYHVFYENGIVKSIKKDTVIKKVYVQYLQEFYPTGILKFQKFFCGDTECYIWKEYNTDGSLLKKINKGKLLNPEPGVIYGYPEDEIYNFVIQQAHYKGDEREFNNYLETRLSDLYRNYKFLKDEYEVLFEIDKTGVPKFISIKGYESRQIEHEINRIISRMPEWIYAKKNGRPATEVFKVQFSINNQ